MPLAYDPEFKACLLRMSDEMRWQFELRRFERIEAALASMDGLSEDQVERRYRRMLRCAEPETEAIVSDFIDAIRAARAVCEHFRSGSP